MHQLPPKPVGLRVKVWRRLQQQGAIAIKNSVYALPLTDAAREDFQWLAREITESGGEATVCAAELVEGLTDAQVQALFNAARDAQYAELTKDARQLAASRDRRRVEETWPLEVSKLRKRLEEIVAIDFLGAPGRMAAETQVLRLEQLIVDQSTQATASASTRETSAPQGAAWVTRRGIHVDRMASAWLIRRFIDPAARLRYVDPRGYRHEPGELRFDMFEAEYTHEGDLCTFEVLLSRFGLTAASLRAIGEMVHDVDLKDSKFGRPETPGFERVIAGIALGHAEDEDRLARASALLDDLHTAFEHQRRWTEAPPQSSRKASRRTGSRRRRRR
ncbi:MAG TPA: chromate resistance protein ChrB domain-containing protein [Myxococcaceae bacterium]|nr:chromate resistance protein ChrB domain-containing protein [Myxococcaceae bacterium]